MSTRSTIVAALLPVFLCRGFLASLEAQTQPARAQARITRSINDRSVVRLPNTTPLRILNSTDRGRAPGSLPMEHLVLALKSSSEQRADAEQLLAQQQDPASPLYHRWLTPQEFGERFGVSTSDLAKITEWLRGHGFRVDRIASGRRHIEFSGTARQIEQAFHTEIHRYQLNGEMHTANSVDVSIPEALSPVVEGIVSLHDFRATSMIARKTRLGSSSTIVADTNLTGGKHGLSPFDFAAIYDLLPLWNQGIDGTGQTIAVVARTNIDVTDISTFRSRYGLPSNPPQIIVTGTDPGIVDDDEESEADLDVEWAGAVAKGATIKLVVSQSTNGIDGTFLSAFYIVDNNVAPVVSMSFGNCEDNLGDANDFYADVWQQAAAQGQSVFVAAGDNGSAGCDSAGSTLAQLGLGVSGAASTPYNVAVGGTQFNENGADSTYWKATNDSTNLSSAKGYIPEVAWNESGSSGLWSGSGGVSKVYSKPAWQAGPGVPAADPGTTAGQHRYVPDVSLTAAAHDGYLLQSGGTLFLASGTSASTPAFAGIMALLNQISNQANGNPNPQFYALAAQSASIFHDVISGTIAVPCASGTPDCTDGMTNGYGANAGYDLATGLGSPDIFLLARSWTAPPVTPAPMITSPATLPSGMAGAAYQQTLTASGGTPPYRWVIVAGITPPGVTLSADGVLSGIPTGSGTFTFTVVITDDIGAASSKSFTVSIARSAPVTGTSATASTHHIFPQFADGYRPDGTYYRTTLMITNPASDAGVNCTLQLHGLTVPGYNFNYVMGPNGWVINPTSGQQPFQSGYATLDCSAKVEAQLLYSLYLSNGTKVSEATAFSSPEASVVLLVADQRENAQLGIAIANDSDQSATYTIRVSNTSAVGTITLNPRTSSAKFLNELIPEVPADLGTVLISSNDGSGSVLGLRFTGNIFTTIPGNRISPAGATAAAYHVFPQFADGQSSDGTFYRTTRMYFNLSSSATPNCTTELHGLTSDGSSGYSADLAPVQAVVSTTTGTQALQTGYATLLCSSDVEAQQLYSYYAGDGTKLGEATVFSSPSAQTVQILADSREGARVGLAIANDSDQTTTYTITAEDANGNTVGATTQTLAAGTSIARFVDQFITLPADHVGPVIVTSSGTASIIGLRFTGNAFTTIPETIR